MHVLIQDSTLTAIADAIRAKNGGTARYKPSEMPGAIGAIPSGGSLVISSANLHDSSTDIENTYLQDGVETAYNGWSATDYIPVNAGVAYAVRTAAQIQGSYCAIYGTDQKLLHGTMPGGFLSSSGGAVFFQADSDGYIRFSAQNTTIRAMKISRCTGGFVFEQEA